jgi:hypothetical protein
MDGVNAENRIREGVPGGLEEGSGVADRGEAPKHQSEKMEPVQKKMRGIHEDLPALGWCQRGAVPPLYRRGVGGRRSSGGEGGMDPAGRKQVLSLRSRPRW